MARFTIGDSRFEKIISVPFDADINDEYICSSLIFVLVWQRNIFRLTVNRIVRHQLKPKRKTFLVVIVRSDL